MKNSIGIKRLFAFALLLLSVVAISSCEKDDNNSSDQVLLLSFGPTGAMHGDTLMFIGRNLDRVTAIDFTGATVAEAAFISRTPEQIKVIVPNQTERGFVTLKTPQGDIVTKTILNLEVAVKVTGVPAQARPGDDITITGEYLNWVTSIKFPKDIWVDSADFVSASVNELVVKVPREAQTGQLVFSFGGTGKGLLEVEAPTSIQIALPAVTGMAPNPIVREENLTITGTNLDLTKGVLFKGKSVADTVFVSKSATQLVIKVPKEANRGKITLVAYSLVTVESPQNLLFLGELPDLAPVSYAFYVDKLENNWENWSWGSTVSFDNTDNIRDGAAAIKMDYTGPWGALKFANSSVATAGYNELTFSIFGTPGTDGKKINVAANGGASYVITIEANKWVEYKLTKAQFGNPATITDLMFQNQDWLGVVYIDHVGLR